MHRSKDSYFIEKHVNGSVNNSRRMSTSGFEYPNEFNNSQISRNFTTISEEKTQSTMFTNIQQSVNGAKKNEFSIPNFYSENNINNHCNSTIRNMMSTTQPGGGDTRFNYNDPTSIPKFISTPLIANTSIEDSVYNNNFIDTKNLNHNNYTYDSYNFMPNNCAVTSTDMPNQYNNFFESMCTNNQYYNGSYLPSPYVIYDPRSNSFQNVMLVPQMMPVMNPSMELNEENQYYLQQINESRNIPNFGYPDYENYPPHETMNLNNQFDTFLTQSFETNGFSHDLKEETAFNELTQERDEVDAIRQAESESLHSLNRNISGDSEGYSSEDDQLNMVQGDEMLEELQKLSSVFTNVVNVSVMSRNVSISEPIELLNNSNSSRFKKTRIKERTTYWSDKQAIVKDNLVKIIPQEVLKIPFIDHERLDQFEDESFRELLANKIQTEKTLELPDCVHSILRRSTFNESRIHKHSNRSSQWRRPSTTPLSLNEFPHPPNQLLKPNISSRYTSHRKSLQIPLPFPLLVNKFIPLLSPVIPHCNKAFYEQSNSNIINNSRRKRRWSVSCSCLDTESSNSPHANYVNHTNESPRDNFNDFLESHQSEELSEKDTQHFVNSFESRIDHHLFCLKRSLIGQFDLSLRDMRSEIKSMKNIQIELESQLLFYKNKLDSMEQSIKNSLPKDEWKSFGISLDLES